MTLPFPTELSAAEADNLADIDTLVNEFSIPRAEAEFALLRAHEVLATMQQVFNSLKDIEPIRRRVLVKALVLAGMQNFVALYNHSMPFALAACAQAYSEDQSNG